MSDREALGDGEDARVTTDGDLACRSIECIDANRDLPLCTSQPGMIKAVCCQRAEQCRVQEFRAPKNAGIGNPQTKKQTRCWSDQSQKGAGPLRSEEEEGEGNRGRGSWV